MPTAFDNKFLPLATKLVNKFGLSATLHTAIGCYDVNTDKVGGTSGLLVGTLTDEPAGSYWDRDTTFQVSGFASGTLTSSTELQVLNGANRMYVGSELVAYANATNVSGDLWTLDTLLRGLDGTAIVDHADGEAVSLVSPEENVTVTVTPLLTFGLEEVDEVNILRTDGLIYLAAEGLTSTPSREMECTHSGTRFKIKNVWPVYSGQQVAVYKLQLRANG